VLVKVIVNQQGTNLTVKKAPFRTGREETLSAGSKKRSFRVVVGSEKESHSRELRLL